MKKVIVSMFVAAAMMVGVNAAAQNACCSSKSTQKVSTEVKTDACKKTGTDAKCAKKESSAKSTDAKCSKGKSEQKTQTNQPKPAKK